MMSPATMDSAIDQDVVCRVEDLGIRFPSLSGGDLQPVQGVDLTIRRGEAIGIVGESGSGKTLTAMALLGLLPRRAEVEGRILIGGEDVLALDERRLARLRSHQLALIMQDPTPSLNPLRTVRSQLRETAALAGVPQGEADARIETALEEVGLDAATVSAKRPFELSGGMNQRVAIAMALVKRPAILIADEPTTALDVTTQAALIDLLARVREREGLSLVMISHDLAVVRRVVDRVAVMYGGLIVEQGPVDEVIAHPRHPYTRALIAAMPRLAGGRGERLTTIPGQLLPVRVGDAGCVFAPRCSRATDECRLRAPLPEPEVGGRMIACFHPGEDDA